MSEFEQTYVHEIYDEISLHFSATRFSIWPLVKRFIEPLPSHSLVSDIGCGNGKNLIASALQNHIAFGCDISIELCRLALTSIQNRQLVVDVFHADGLITPFKSNIFDATLSIAVIHHFSTLDRRTAALQELHRITKPKGKVLVSVWAYGQPKMSKWKPIKFDDNQPSHDDVTSEETQDFIVPWHLRKDLTHKESREKGAKSLGRDDRGDVIHGRYYYLFKQGELDELFEKVGFSIVESYFECDNYVVIGEKSE
ncbi:hypothetical protein P9112_000132 [Eukaryota sp. TZLM1-RC]